MTFNPPNTLSPFLPNYQTFSQDASQFLIQLTKIYTDIAKYLNIREIGIYELTETLTGQQWPTAGNPQQYRQSFRKVFFIGSIAPGVLSLTPHGLTNVTSYTRIYGTAVTNDPDSRSLPYPSAVALTNQIEMRIDATNIIILNGTTSPTLLSSTVVLEYLKN